MQQLIIIILSFILLSCDGNIKPESGATKAEVVETNSDCLKNLPNDFFILDTLKTHAGSLIYWQYNKDSSWLTYEEVRGNKTTLNSLDCSLMGYTYKLGTQRFDVYPKYVVFYHKWISGCCTPPDIIFMDNKVPKELRRIDSQSMIQLEDDYCLFFNDTTYNSASFLALNSNKSTMIYFPKGLLKSKIDPSRNLYPRDFINDAQVTGNNLKLIYRYKNAQSDSEWIKDSIIVKLKK